MKLKRAISLLLAALAVTVGLSACSGGMSGDTYTAEFDRAVQVFPGVKVRVLGVDVGQVLSVRNVPGGVEVEFEIDRDDVQVPADVSAAVVPQSLLGERYIQLFPAYSSGPVLQPGATIPRERTAVPSEPDELLRSLQDYLGGIDPETVSEFVSTAAETLDGKGQELNDLIGNAARVFETLAAKRDDLAVFIVELNKLTQALATRRSELTDVIVAWNTVAGTLNRNRDAVEGTITGLSEAASELATLLLDHRRPLARDIEALTRTTRTLSRNAETFARTGYWAKLLFQAASRAVDYDHDWLRLGNQGAPLAALILMRVEQRLMELCADAGSAECANPAYWAAEVPQLFCFVPSLCPEASTDDREQAVALAAAIEQQPEIKDDLEVKAAQAACVDARNPDRCFEREMAANRSLEAMVVTLLEQTIGSPMTWGAEAGLLPDGNGGVVTTTSEVLP
jgi:virulence factor Mce-like protein